MKCKVYRLCVSSALLLVFYDLAFACSLEERPIIEVPFMFVRGNVVSQVTIKGKGPFNMVLATGSANSTLSPDLLKELKLQAYFTYADKYPIDTKYVIYARVAELQVGDFKSNPFDMRLDSLNNLSQSLGIRLHGILGSTFLNGAILQIDYSKRIIRFLPTSPLTSPSNQQNATQPGLKVVLPIEISQDDPLPIIDEVFIEGKKVRTLVDTAQGLALALTPAAVKYLGLPETPDKAPPRIGKVNTLKIGAIQIDSPTTALFGKGTDLDHGLRRYGAIIGGEFLSKYVITLDYRRKVLVIEQP